MGTDRMENENHLLYECNLYSGLRAKLINQLNNAPHHQCDDYTQLNIDMSSLKENLMIQNELEKKSKKLPLEISGTVYGVLMRIVSISY